MASTDRPHSHLFLASEAAPPSELMKQLHDYRLTTAEILYHMPDHPKLLQSYVWQELDIAPRFPVLHRFLHFWEERLDGKLFRVKVSNLEVISAAEWRYAGCEFVIQ